MSPTKPETFIITMEVRLAVLAKDHKQAELRAIVAVANAGNDVVAVNATDVVCCSREDWSA